MVEVAHRTIEAQRPQHPLRRGRRRTTRACSAVGFRSHWYSWRHQLQALAEAGYHAVAPDMRGYGRTDKPEAIDQYTIFHLTGDMIGLARALSPEKAASSSGTIGARRLPGMRRCSGPTAFAASLDLACRSGRAARQGRRARCRRPNHRFSISSISRRPEWPKPNSSATRATQSRAASFREAATRPRLFDAMIPRSGGFLTSSTYPQRLPSWLTETDIDFLRKRVRPHRLPRRSQLVPQHRPQLGTDGAVPRRANDPSGALHGGR